jgi:photosystem II stability/assembly factor-like uncharacterized protein
MKADYAFRGVWRGCVVDDGKLLLTEDGGKTWVIQLADRPYLLRAVFFVDGNRGTTNANVETAVRFAGMIKVRRPAPPY